MIDKPIVRVGAILLGICLAWPKLASCGPTLFNGRGRTFGGVDAEYQYWQIEGKDTYSRRFGFTASHGLTPWMDVFGRAGISQLRIEFPDFTPSDMVGSYKFGGGLGARIKLLQFSNVAVYAEGRGLLYYSEGDVSQVGQVGEVIENQAWEWREAEGGLGIALELRQLSLYGGVSVSVIQTFTDREKRAYEDSRMVGDPSVSPTEEFRSDPLADPVFIGAIFGLPRDFKLNVKLKGPGSFDEPDDFGLCVSLTQFYEPGRPF